MGKELNYFLENLASLLSAGIPILEALASMRAEARSPRLKRKIEEMMTSIEDGAPLSLSLERSGLFSAHVSALLHLGERSGKLVENLKIVAAEEEKRHTLNSKVRSAAMYPLFVLSLTIVIGVAIAWFILPKLALVFSQLRISLPAITEALIGLGRFLDHYGIYAVPAFFLVLGLIIYLFFFSPEAKIVGEHILLSLPGVKTLLKQAEISRFGYLLGTLLAAGLPPTESLRSLAQATSLVRYQHLYSFLAEGIAEGNSFKKSFAAYDQINNLLPAPIQQLIVAGEQSGSLAPTLLKISAAYETKADTTAKDLAVMLEPILLVIVWLGVVAVALAVILPIYSLVGQLNTGQ